MGLDMWLYATRYLSEFSGKDKLKEVKALFPEVKTRADYSARVEFEVGYWRKANQIHKWFVDNCQEGVDDCRSAYVDREHLQELLNECKKVVSLPEGSDPKTILPRTEGFFFGSTKYDKWYIEDIEKTIKIIEEALKLPNDYEFEYHSSW